MRPHAGELLGRGDTFGKEGREGTTLGAGLGQAAQDIEVVVAIFPSGKGYGATGPIVPGTAGTTVPAGLHERLTDVIIFKRNPQQK